jgi:hypothetical protein
MVALSSAGSTFAANSLHVTVDDLGGDIRLTGRYQISNPPFCLATRPAADAPDSSYKEWADRRCAPYIAQHSSFRVSVLYLGRSVFSYSFDEDGPNWDPLQGGRLDPYHIYCDVLMWKASTPGGIYDWKLTLIDPFHRPGYNVSRGGAFYCGRVVHRSHPH